MKRKIKAYSFLAALCSFLGMLWGSQRFLKVTRKAIVIDGLDEELDGMRILHISDLHAQNPVRVAVNVWEKAAELDIDIVAITGDIIDKSAYQLEPHIAYIKKLALEYPVFFAEGNHDHYSMKKLRPMLEGAGVTVLTDEKTVFEHNGRCFEVVGLSNYYTADLNTAASLFTKSNMFRLALMHQPQQIDYVEADASPCLTLAGHTHGGLWRAPLLPAFYAPGQGFMPKYDCGEYNINGSKLFVSRGVGATGKVPFRLWNRPEICVITLKAGE